jgi:Na+/H+-dicarboxylate symporter
MKSHLIPPPGGSIRDVDGILDPRQRSGRVNDTNEVGFSPGRHLDIGASAELLEGLSTTSQSLPQFLLRMVPDNIVDAMARGDVLPVILAVDRVLDMMRTSVNVWSDLVGAAVITRFEGRAP